METLDYPNTQAGVSVETLKSASIFGALSDEGIRFLLSRGRILALADNEALFLEGEPGDSFYVVLDGRIDYFRNSVTGELLLRSAGFGEQLGYVSMVGLIPRAGVARARSRTVVLEVSSTLFFEFHEALPFDFGIIMLNLARDLSRIVIYLGDKLESVRARELALRAETTPLQL